MTQLSPLSQQCLARIRSILLSLQHLLSSSRVFFTKTIPEIGQNIAFALIALKDIATFVPPNVYKTLVLIIGLSFLLRYRRRGRKRQVQMSKKKEKMVEQDVKIEKCLDQLGPEFQVKHNEGPTGPETQDEQDSCCQDLTHQLAKSDDFRDIVFFQLMRGYSLEGNCQQIKEVEQEEINHH